MRDAQDFSGIGLAVAIDVETTGLDPDADRIVSVAAVTLTCEEGRPLLMQERGVVNVLVNPGVPIPAAATRVHGITDDMVADAPLFAGVAQEVRDYVGDLPLVGHNVQFDKKFLNAALKRAGVKSLHRNRSYCTMRRMSEFARDELGEPWRRWSLDDTLDELGLEGRGGKDHDAMEDAVLALTVAGAFAMHDRGVWNLAPPVPTLLPTEGERGGERSRQPDRPDGGGQISAKWMWWSIAGIVAVVAFALAQTV